jgi:type II secretory pathway component PulM
METGIVSQNIKNQVFPVLEHIDQSIEQAMTTQSALKAKLERLLAELQVLSAMTDQAPLDQALVRCVIARKRILNVQRKLVTIQQRLTKLDP